MNRPLHLALLACFLLLLNIGCSVDEGASNAADTGNTQHDVDYAHDVHHDVDPSGDADAHHESDADVNDGADDDGQSPFGGVPHTIPGVIQAVDFDEGGPGVAYFDTTEENQGGEYRPGESVDIEASDDSGHNVGWIDAGEWLEYTVNVAEADRYEVQVLVSSQHDGRHFHIQFGGEDVTGRIDVPNTGDWQSWTTVTISDVELDAGLQVMRIAMDSDLFNLKTVTVRTRPDVAPADFYVSPGGNDDNPGTADEPFRTIARARDAVRQINSDMSADVLVYLREGRFEQPGTLRFQSQDSGSNGFDVIYRAYPGETPSISGGQVISGWTAHQGGIFRASAGSLRFRQLYVDARRQTRARTPNSGDYHRLVSWDEAPDAIGARVHGADIDNWARLQGVEMVINKHWNQSRFRLELFTRQGDFANVIFQAPERNVERLVDWPNREPNQVYYFENSLDFLDHPGEWYLDPDAGQVYYMPHPGEDMSNVTVIAPLLERLVELNGARNLVFDGVAFEHTNWTTPDEEGFIGTQAASYRVLNTGRSIPPGIHLESTTDVRFERNVFRNMGGVGVSLAQGTLRTEFVGNVLYDIASTGIEVYTTLSDRNPPEHLRSRHDVIRNNYVTRVAQDYTGGVGIWGSYTHHLLIEHNEIAQLPYTGISIGWGWSANDTAHQATTVRYNEIHDVMQTLDDGAGIYTLSKQPGSLVEENYVYNIARSPWADSYEIAALYLDEQTQGLTLRNNVVHNLTGANMLVVKLHQVNPDLVTVGSNGEGLADEANIIERAGLEPAYEDIRLLVQ